MKYHVTYTVDSHPEGLERAELPENRGACTAILLGSLLYPDDGSYGAAFVSLDGRTGESLGSAEVWKAWSMLTKHLADDPNLSGAKRELCSIVFETICAAIMKTRATE